MILARFAKGYYTTTTFWRRWPTETQILVVVLAFVFVFGLRGWLGGVNS
jgi:hypothetical protein